jgi:hypothetical protein
MNRIEWIAHMHDVMYRSLWFFVEGVTDEELDWKIHPKANTIRWLLSHLLWIEEWTADAIEETGKYLVNRDPKEYEPRSLEEIREDYGKASKRTQNCMKELSESDLERQIDMIGVMTRSLLVVLENHVTHTGGHMYQIRLIRGTYSREQGGSKTAFDKW